MILSEDSGIVPETGKQIFHIVSLECKAFQNSAKSSCVAPLRIIERSIVATPSKPKRFGRLVGASAEMKRVFAAIAKAAKVDLPVLLVGETGTGKELVAQEIHARSVRKDNPFVPINMGAVPHELVASELFGHLKGAFTGASEAHIGCFEEAKNGILFLDEITTMEDSVQVALLRVLETKQFRPVGASGTRMTDARIIAATNVPLREAVESGSFREDLMHRLQVLQINLPSLRSNRSDIPMLATYFLAEFCEEFNFPIASFEADTIRLLKAYSWPGNLRELKNVIAQSAVTAETGIINPVHLPDRIRGNASSEASTADPRIHSLADSDEFDPADPGHNGVSLPLVIPMEDVERAYISQALQYCANNKTETARRLGISRKALYDKLHRWGLS